MLKDILLILLLSSVGGVISLSGGIILLSNKNTADLLARYMAPFAAGALLASAFLDLLPEALEAYPISSVLWWSLVGIVIFFLLERFLRWFHHHHEHESDRANPAAALVIVGDTIHNFIDGIAIAAAYLVNLPTGIITTFAVAAHEIPQEVGDFGILLRFGVKRKKVLLMNVLSAFATIIAALLTLMLNELYQVPLGPILGLTAGFFIYIAASDIIPTIHSDVTKRRGQIESAMLILGILVVGLVSSITHQFIKEDGLDDSVKVAVHNNVLLK